MHEMVGLNAYKLKLLDEGYIREQRESFELQMDGLHE